MAEVTFTNVAKEYPNGFVAVRDLDLTVADGELLVVVGPSGCGKTTTLRMLAGLEDISQGTIQIGDRVINDLSAKERDIAMVFQSYALYPHLSVGDNLGYPLRMAKLPKKERAERVVAVAKQLQLEELLERKPRQLSGGQRQRVAMGRAMVRNPSVFLMDEPLSNLDAKLRVHMRSEVAELQDGLGATMFYVTHDQVEAMTMGHRVAIMDKGVLQQVAPPADLYANPRNLFVAGFIGSPPMNLFNAQVSQSPIGNYEIVSGSAHLAIYGGTPSQIDRLAPASGQDAVIGIRPEHIRLSAHGQLHGVVKVVELLGSESLIHIDVEGLDYYAADADAVEETGSRPKRLLVKIHEDSAAIPAVGDVVAMELPGHRVHTFDARSGISMMDAALV